MSPDRPAGDHRTALPRGVIVLGLLLYGITLIAAAVVIGMPAAGMNGLPRWTFALGALVCATLATGLFRRRRWAWYATLTFVIVNAYYLVRSSAERGQNAVFGLTVLAIVAGYLYWPEVRAVYLGGVRSPRRHGDTEK